MTDGIFLYRFTWDTETNPPKRKLEFEESLKQYGTTHGLNVHMGAMGGMRTTYGTVHRDKGELTKDDRTLLADWVRQQPVRLKATFGPVELDHPELELFRDVDDLVFDTDNLTPDDLLEAERWRNHVRSLVEESRPKAGLPKPKCD